MSVIAEHEADLPEDEGTGDPHDRPGAARRRAGWSSAALGVLSILVPILVIGTVFLMPYLRGETEVPFGFDTPYYLWRANVVMADGPRALESFPVPDLNPSADRPSFPVLASFIDAAGGPEPALLVFVVPAVFAIAVGLAAGAFAGEALEEPAWAFVVFALVTGVSLAVVRTAVGSIDNLVVDSVVLAAMTATIVSASGRRGTVGAVALLGGAAIIHWIFAGITLALLLALLVALIPISRRQLAEGARLRTVPSSRVGVVVGAGLIAGLASLALTSAIHFARPEIPPAKVSRKVAQRIPALRLPVGVPAAVAGAIALWFPRSTPRRWGCILLVIWGLALLVGTILYLAGSELPLYRLAEFTLAIPILGAAALVAVARWAGAKGAAGSVAAIVAVAAILAVAAWSAERSWAGSPRPLIDPQTTREVAAATAYLEALPADRPIVFVGSTERYIAADRPIRAALPGDLVARTRVFLGDASDLLQGRPTSTDPTSAYARSWAAIEPILDDPYVAVWLKSANPLYGPPPGSLEIAPGVRVVRGPAPTPILRLPALVTPSAADLIAAAAASLAILLFAGLGWSVCLADVSWLSRVGLAPAFGIAFLTLIGALAGRLGWSSTGATGVALLAAVAGSGWVAASLVRYRSSATGTERRGEPGGGDDADQRGRRGRSGLAARRRRGRRANEG